MNNLWIYYAIAGCLITALNIVILRLISLSKYDNILCVCYAYLLVAIFGLIYIFYNKKSNSVLLNSKDSNIFYIILALSFVCFFKMMIVQKALKNTSNLSYTHVIINLNVIVVLFASYFFFNEKFNIQTLIGILLANMGVSMIIYYS